MRTILFLTVFCVSLFSKEVMPETIKQNGCLTCHAIKWKKTAPAFTGIARRNKTGSSAIAKRKIQNSIKYGSKGKYPNFRSSAMPPYGHLSVYELNLISSWILSLDDGRKSRGRGQRRGKGNF